MRWPTIAKKIRREYVEGTKCKICGKVLFSEKDTAIIQLKNIYQHFKKEHNNIVEEIKQRIKTRTPAPILIDVVFKKPHSTESETEEEVETRVEIEQE